MMISIDDERTQAPAHGVDLCSPNLHASSKYPTSAEPTVTEPQAAGADLAVTEPQAAGGPPITASPDSDVSGENPDEAGTYSAPDSGDPDPMADSKYWWMPGGQLFPDGNDGPLRVLPGAELAGKLDSYEVAKLSTELLDDGIVAWERLMAWCQARQYAWITEFAWRVENAQALRTSARSDDERGRDRVEPVQIRDSLLDKIHLTNGACVAELSALLSISSYESKHRLETAQALDTFLLGTAEALETGTITPNKATLMANRLKDVDPVTALAVEETALPVGAQQPHAVMARHISRALIEVDPESADVAHLLARTQRRVNFPSALPNGMASLKAILPADQARLIHSNLTSVANGRKSSGDDRTIDQLRADTLMLLATDPGCCLPQHYPSTFQTEDSHSSEPHSSEPNPSEPNPPEPNPSGSHDAGSHDAGSQPTDPRLSGSHDAAPTTRHAHSRACYEVLVTVSADTLAAAIASASSDPPPNQVEDAPSARSGNSSNEPALNPIANTPTPTLTGYGPISPLLATMLAASPRARWRMATLDSETGKVLSVARRTYKPPPDLARIVLAREPECVFPSCIRTSQSCDLDHTIAFSHTDPDQGGATEPGNLAPLCRTHHNLKTLGLWHLAQPEEGHYEWISLLGHKYTYHPRTPNSVPTVHEIFAPEPTSEIPVPY